jgi:hypothetical protein
MNRHSRTSERLVALFLLGTVLLVPPVLLVFNRPMRVLGIPTLYLYLFVIWIVLIFLGRVLANRIAVELDSAQASAGEPGAGVRSESTPDA